MTYAKFDYINILTRLLKVFWGKESKSIIHFWRSPIFFDLEK